MADSPVVDMPIKIPGPFGWPVDEGLIAFNATLYLGEATSDAPGIFFEPHNVSWQLIFTIGRAKPSEDQFNSYVRINLPQKLSGNQGYPASDPWWTNLGVFQIDTSRIPANVLTRPPFRTWNLNENLT